MSVPNTWSSRFTEACVCIPSSLSPRRHSWTSWLSLYNLQSAFKGSTFPIWAGLPQTVLCACSGPPPAVSLHCSVMWLDSSQTHSSVFKGLQLQSSCWCVLLLLISRIPAVEATPHLSDQMLLVHRKSTKGCDDARCWDWYLSLRLNGLTFSKNVFERRSPIDDSSVFTSWHMDETLSHLVGSCQNDTTI